MWTVLFAARLAAQETPDLGTYAPILNLGAVGVICVALFIFARATVADLRAQRDVAQEDARRKTRITELERTIADLRQEVAKAQDDLTDLNREVRSQMIPALVTATATMTRVVSILDDRRQ
jgi:cell division protein FtsB